MRRFGQLLSRPPDDNVHPHQVTRVGHIDWFEFNETTGDDFCLDSMTAVQSDRPPGVCGVASVDGESGVYSNANDARSVFIAEPESSDYDGDANSDAVATEKEDFGTENVIPHNLGRWPSVDFAYDADTDEMPLSNEKKSESFRDTLNRDCVPGPKSDSDDTGDVEAQSVDVVVASVVGANAVRTDVVGANVVVVGDEPFRDFDEPNSDEKSRAHSNTNDCNPVRWETPYTSDTTSWGDDSDDESRANEGATGHDVDVAGVKRGGDAIGRESELTTVSQVSTDQKSGNDDWGQGLTVDHEPLRDDRQEEFLQRESVITRRAGVSFGKQSKVVDLSEDLPRVQSNAVSHDKENNAQLNAVPKQPSGQSKVVSLDKQLNIQSTAINFDRRPSVQPKRVVSLDSQPNIQSNVVSFNKKPIDQSKATTRTYTTDPESEDEYASDARQTSPSKDQAECSRTAAIIDSEEKIDPVEEETDKSSYVVNGDRSNVKPEKVKSEGVGAELNVVPKPPTVDWSLPVDDDEPVTWVKSGDDFDWTDADSDVDSKPPYRLLCGCFPRRRRHLSIQLRRYRIRKATKEDVDAEKEATDTNFVEIKCPRETSFGRFRRSR